MMQHGFHGFPQQKQGQIIGMFFISAIENRKVLRKIMKPSMVDGMMMP